MSIKKEKYTVNFARTKVGNFGNFFEEKSKISFFWIKIRFFRFESNFVDFL